MNSSPHPGSTPGTTDTTPEKGDLDADDLDAALDAIADAPLVGGLNAPVPESTLTADTELGRPGDSSDIRGTVAYVFARLKPDDPEQNLKSCPICGNKAPLPKGENVTVKRLAHSLRVTVWGRHGHDGEKQSKNQAKWYSHHYWRPPLPAFDRGDHVELGRDLAKQLGGRGRASYTAEFGIRVYDGRERTINNPEGGSWRLQTEEVVSRAVTRYAGRFVASEGKKPRPINLRANDIAGIVKVAKVELAEDAVNFDVPHVVAFTNGNLNVVTRRFDVPEPGHRTLSEHILPFPYDVHEQGPDPRWLSFLREVLGDDEDKVKFLQEFVGAALHGRAAAWQTHPVLVGSGANGKSTLIKVLRALFPKDAVSSSSPSSWSATFGRATLANAMLNLVTDMDERELLKDSGSIKAILSADPIEIEKKFKDRFVLVPKAGHVFACNRLPTSADRSHGFFRRFVVLQFDRVFAPHEQDHRLEEFLTSKHVLSGIYSWAREGYERRVKQGHYTVPVSHKAAVREWREKSDSALAWASACLMADAAAREGSARLYQCYRSWCERTGHRSQSMKSWGETMATEFGKSRSKAGMVYNVRLVPDESVGAADEVVLDFDN